MSRARMVVAAVVLWCAVVAAGASLVWVVIDHAGQGVVPTSQAAQAPRTGSLPVPGHPRSRPTPPRPSGGHHTVGAGPPTGTTAAPPPSTPPSVTPPAVPVRQESWSGTAGHLVAQCRGSVGSLVSAYPNPGWGYAIESRGPALVRVRYKRTGEDRYVTVSAHCANGNPDFSVSFAVPGDE